MPNLLAIDPVLAREPMATGLPGWQARRRVAGTRPRVEIRTLLGEVWSPRWT